MVRMIRTPCGVPFRLRVANAKGTPRTCIYIALLAPGIYFHKSLLDRFVGLPPSLGGGSNPELENFLIRVMTAETTKTRRHNASVRAVDHSR
jgi:hypothetical protein